MIIAAVDPGESTGICVIDPCAVDELNSTTIPAETIAFEMIGLRKCDLILIEKPLKTISSHIAFAVAMYVTWTGWPFVEMVNKEERIPYLQQAKETLSIRFRDKYSNNEPISRPTQHEIDAYAHILAWRNKNATSETE